MISGKAMLLKTNPRFPSELQSLGQLRMFKGQDPESPSYNGYYYALMEKTKWALLYAKDEHAAAITLCWMEHLSKTLHMSEFFTMHSRNTDKIVGLIAKHQLTEFLTKQVEMHPVLASLCITRVALSAQGEPAVKANGIKELLVQWTGYEPEDTTLLSMPDMVAYLYGPGAWELYGVDAANITQVQTVFYSLGLPVTLSKKNQPQDSMESAIPGDLA